eukprot:TRINITY_DN7236_c0_g1_i1.p1 TRINITY_DN7236_c0_g1~~TRINITY_DN7236_c0_g1_i1.p1  ORF type:complete len:434 (-),score=105.30 TRINITY_DN7236_c0_g1_i1:1038-2339(-)
MMAFFEAPLSRGWWLSRTAVRCFRTFARPVRQEAPTVVDAAAEAAHLPPTPTVADPAAAAEGFVNSGIIWFDNIFPIRVHSLDFRYLLAPVGRAEKLLKRLFDKSERITRIEPRKREGGTFVHFRSRTKSAEEVAEIILNDLKAAPKHSFFNVQEVRAHLVKGKPFNEDLLNRWPSFRLRVEFKGPSLSEEVLYSHLRTYGKIVDITKASDTAKIVQFKRIHGAVAARNCFHRVVLGETEVKMLYEPMIQSGWLGNLFNKHPRIMIPATGAFFASFTYLIFDPMRVFFITNKITGRFSVSDFGVVNWMRVQYRQLRHTDEPHTEASILVAQSKLLGEYLTGPPEAVLFLTGAKGTGKSGLIRKALEQQKYTLRINTARLYTLRDEDFAHGFAKEVGFFPSFAAMKWISAFVDSMLGVPKSNDKPTERPRYLSV